MKFKKVCIVTPDFVGPIRNGGIGTHCYHLARLLVSAGHETTVLYTGGFEVSDSRHWAKYFAEKKIRFVSSRDMACDEVLVTPSTHMADSIRVHKCLSRESFDVVHFQCWQGNGFVPTQAKSCGLAHQATTITETLHATESWALEGMKAFPDNPAQHSYQDYCERYSFAHADYGLSPTQHMFDWTAANGWESPRQTRLIPLPFLHDPQLLPKQDPRTIDSSHLVFFGRVETRKGFELFVDALKLLAQGAALRVRKLSILGKQGRLTGRDLSPAQLIGELGAIAPHVEIAWLDKFDHHEALNYIMEQGGVLVIPSLHDNSPFTAIEAMVYRIPFIASNVGGIPEISGKGEHIFDTTPESLAAAISRIDEIPFHDLVYPYSAEQANARWLEFHEGILQEGSWPELAFKSKPRVSVCTAHRNMTPYLSEALQSLRASDYGDLEVVCVDESDQPEHIQSLQRLSEEYEAFNWQFIRTDKRSGPSRCRNIAAERAHGEFLVFFDADNIATPEMISKMVASITFSGADCMTCHLKAFAHTKHIQNEQPLYVYAPLGPVLDIGFIHNVFGDTNFIIKREVFQKLGGFPEDNWGVWEDWEFLAGLALEGYRLDVIPEALFWYRHTETGASRGFQVNNFDRYQFVLRPWRKRFPHHIARILEARLVQDGHRNSTSTAAAGPIPPEVTIYLKILHAVKFSRFQGPARKIITPVRRALSRLIA